MARYVVKQNDAGAWSVYDNTASEFVQGVELSSRAKARDEAKTLNASDDTPESKPELLSPVSVVLASVEGEYFGDDDGEAPTGTVYEDADSFLASLGTPEGHAEPVSGELRNTVQGWAVDGMNMLTAEANFLHLAEYAETEPARAYWATMAKAVTAVLDS